MEGKALSLKRLPQCTPCSEVALSLKRLPFPQNHIGPCWEPRVTSSIKGTQPNKRFFDKKLGTVVVGSYLLSKHIGCGIP